MRTNGTNEMRGEELIDMIYNKDGWNIDLSTAPDGKIISLMFGPRIPKDLVKAARDEWARRKNKEIQELAEEASDRRGVDIYEQT